MLEFTGVLVIAIKQKSEYNFCAPAVLYIL